MVYTQLSNSAYVTDGLNDVRNVIYKERCNLQWHSPNIPSRKIFMELGIIYNSPTINGFLCIKQIMRQNGVLEKFLNTIKFPSCPFRIRFWARSGSNPKEAYVSNNNLDNPTTTPSFSSSLFIKKCFLHKQNFFFFCRVVSNEHEYTKGKGSWDDAALIVTAESILKKEGK